MCQPCHSAEAAVSSSAPCKPSRKKHACLHYKAYHTRTVGIPSTSIVSPKPWACNSKGGGIHIRKCLASTAGHGPHRQQQHHKRVQKPDYEQQQLLNTSAKLFFSLKPAHIPPCSHLSLRLSECIKRPARPFPPPPALPPAGSTTKREPSSGPGVISSPHDRGQLTATPGRPALSPCREDSTTSYHRRLRLTLHSMVSCPPLFCRRDCSGNSFYSHPLRRPC